MQFASSIAMGSQDGYLSKSMSDITLILHLHLSRKTLRNVKMLHFLNSFQCHFSGVFVKMVTPVDCWLYSFATLRLHQLCHIRSC